MNGCYYIQLIVFGKPGFVLRLFLCGVKIYKYLFLNNIFNVQYRLNRVGVLESARFFVILQGCVPRFVGIGL